MEFNSPALSSKNELGKRIMGDMRSQPTAILTQPSACPKSRTFTSVAEIYAAFQKELEGKIFTDPNGKKVTFLAKDFPHLIKLEFFDKKLRRWVEARAKATIPRLLNGTLDESLHRIADKSRARTLFWVPEIIAKPDSINPNKRNLNNTVYAKRYRRNGSGATLKIVLVKPNPDGSTSVVTSFWSDDRYHSRCVHK